MDWGRQRQTEGTIYKRMEKSNLAQDLSVFFLKNVHIVQEVWEGAVDMQKA